MCFVEIEGAPKLATACSTQVVEGMKILTESPKVKAGQNSTLEFTLLHHPLDCPICDRGGECKLQDYTYEFGPPLSRMHDEKKEWDKHRAISHEVVLDQERCILCTRCVRFSSEVDGRAELVVNDRGSHNHIDVFEGRPLESKFAGNVVDLCPVGALTAKDFRFVARPWELKKHQAICTGCSVGCNVNIDTKHRHMGIARPDGIPPNPQIARLMPRENLNINEWWMCDKGRWGYHEHNDDSKRLNYPLVKRSKHSKFEKISLREISLVIDEASKKVSNEWEFWIDDSASHELIAWAKELQKIWGTRGRKVEMINTHAFASQVLDFVKARMNSNPWLMGEAKWGDIKTVVATGDYRSLEDVVPVLSLKLGQRVRKGQLKWVVRDADKMIDASDDLATTAYLAPAPKSAGDLKNLSRIPESAKTLILWTGVNARGLLAEGIAPIEALSPNLLSQSAKKAVFYFGQKNQNPVSKELTSYLKNAPYLIVADGFASELSDAADCVMPLNPVYESKATFTSLEGYRQLSEGVRLDHPNYEYLHRGGDVVPASLRVL
jgi:NADH dehydrogenase/NADH:ubiquinone oxidoreductase subunit G